MADITVADFQNSGGYEQLKAKIEGVSIALTDQIMEFWKQNEDLEVEIDIKPDPHDQPPYNNGPNLYLRIKNRKHRGVSTPFKHRSRGFIWFFSFLVWFDSVKAQLFLAGQTKNVRDIILLLDEPALALHALAQNDFLNYIDNLAERHQVLYTTHSPFMIHSNRLNQIRMIMDKEKIGTTISENISESDDRTIFPLQAALGWTIAQNLFISKNNLLVEGVSELAYLQFVSSILEREGKVGLRSDITIVPVGGIGNVCTFVSLLGANGLNLAVLHDYKGSSEQKLDDLARQKILNQKHIINPSQFRDLKSIGVNGPASDIEDLFTPGVYLDNFNACFSTELSGNKIKESDLSEGNRIIERIERHLVSNKILLRPSGGFNHYAVSSYFVSTTGAALDVDTKCRFIELFKKINSIIPPS